MGVKRLSLGLREPRVVPSPSRRDGAAWRVSKKERCLQLSAGRTDSQAEGHPGKQATVQQTKVGLKENGCIDVVTTATAQV